MRKIKNLLITVITFLVCIVLAESFLAFIAPVSDPYEKRKHHVVNQYIKSEFPLDYEITTEAENGLPGVQGQNTFSTNNMGFRGDNLATQKPFNEFRIYMIGGSTTECFYLDDSQSINTALQNYLQEHVNSDISIKVYNAGISGDASDDHISMLAHRIVHLGPDMIIVFSGINDLTRSIYNYDYLHYVKKSRKIPIFRFLAAEFQIPRRLYYLMKRRSPTDRDILEQITIKSNYKRKIELRKSVPITNEKPRVDSRHYANNLKSIIGLAKSHGIQLVFMTQQSTWNSAIDPNTSNWHWILHRNGKTYREDFMDEALESLNDVMRQVSLERSFPIYDLAKSLPKSLEFFYDDVHFNVRGASIVGKDLGKYILQSGTCCVPSISRRARGLTGAHPP